MEVIHYGIYGRLHQVAVHGLNGLLLVETSAPGSSPAVAINSDGRLDAFVIGNGNFLYHIWQTSAGSSTWSQWSSLGGNIAPGSSPAVAINSDGRLDAFVIGNGNFLYHIWQTSAGSSTWSQWSSLGGNIAGNTSPAVS